jgi:GGDEF domain-containing protein
MSHASVVELRPGTELRSRGLELAAQLRAAVVDGDDARILRLLAELMRFRGLTQGQRTTLQLKALQNLVQTLRAALVNDDATGLLNRRGFLQSGTRVLDVALRNRQPHHLIYFQLAPLPPVTDAAMRLIPVRHLANLMRDLFPNYGVYEVLGRVAATEFAALTPRVEYAARDSILVRLRRPGRNGALVSVPLGVGIAHFDPVRPIAVDELLEKAARVMRAYQRALGIASPGLAPLSG